jgi:hypothetical protein
MAGKGGITMGSTERESQDSPSTHAAATEESGVGRIGNLVPDEHVSALSAAQVFPSTPNTVVGAIVAGGLVISVGTFLPWITLLAPFVGRITKSGMEGRDGPILLFLGLAIASLGFICLKRPKVAWAVLIGAVVSGVAVGFEFSSANSAVQSATTQFSSAALGSGLWVMALGTLAAALGALAVLELLPKGLTQGPSPITPVRIPRPALDGGAPRPPEPPKSGPPLCDMCPADERTGGRPPVKGSLRSGLPSV